MKVNLTIWSRNKTFWVHFTWVVQHTAWKNHNTWRSLGLDDIINSFCWAKHDRRKNQMDHNEKRQICCLPKSSTENIVEISSWCNGTSNNTANTKPSNHVQLVVNHWNQWQTTPSCYWLLVSELNQWLLSAQHLLSIEEHLWSPTVHSKRKVFNSSLLPLARVIYSMNQWQKI